MFQPCPTQERGLSDTPAIELRDVIKRFGETPAVDRVSLQIGDGEFFSLLGPEWLWEDDHPAHDRRV